MNVQERVDYILKEKPRGQHLTRLRHIYYVPEKQAKTCINADKKAWEVLGMAMDKAEKIYDTAVARITKPILDQIPACNWDGITIFKKPHANPK
jgi:hypothetical protein